MTQREREDRRRAVAADYRDGMSIYELRDKYGLTVNYIRDICKGAGE